MAKKKVDATVVIAAMQEAGATQAKVAAKFGISRQRVYQIVGPIGSRERTKELREKALLLRAAGVKADVIAKVLGRSSKWPWRAGIASVPLPAREPRHGTRLGYATDKCRCPKCLAAHAAYAREKYAKRKERLRRLSNHAHPLG